MFKSLILSLICPAILWGQLIKDPIIKAFYDEAGNPIYYTTIDKLNTECFTRGNRCDVDFHKTCSTSKDCEKDPFNKLPTCRTLVTCGPECRSGYIKQPNGTCKADPCKAGTCSEGETCLRDILPEGQPLCVSNYQENAVIVCDEHDLQGSCYSTTNAIEIPTPASILIPVGWEAIIEYNGYPQLAETYDDSQIHNFEAKTIYPYGPYPATPIWSSRFEVDRIQPANYKTFKKHYPDQIYFKVYTSYGGMILSESDIPEFLEKLKNPYAFKWPLGHFSLNPGYKLVLSGPENDPNVQFNEYGIYDPSIHTSGEPTGDEIFQLTRAETLILDDIQITKKEYLTKAEKGITFCHKNLEDCFTLTEHAIFTSDYWHESSPSLIELSINSDWFKYFFLEYGWEAYLCKQPYYDITTCDYVNEPGFYEYDERPQKVIIQPTGGQAWVDFFQENPHSVIAYSEPHFNGRKIIYSQKGIQFNSLSRIRSIMVPENARAYLSKTKTGDKFYLAETSNTIYKFDEQELTLVDDDESKLKCSGSYLEYKFIDALGINQCMPTNSINYDYKYITLEFGDDKPFDLSETEGGIELETILDTNICNTEATPNCNISNRKLYTGDYTPENILLFPQKAILNEITSTDIPYNQFNLKDFLNQATLTVRFGWNIYICSDSNGKTNTETCIKKNSLDDPGIIGNNLPGGSEITRLFIRPTNIDTITQYIGHHEYNGQNSVSNPSKFGFIELFTEENFQGTRDIIFQTDLNLDNNLITGDKIKSIRIHGNIKPEFIYETGATVSFKRNDQHSFQGVLSGIKIEKLTPTVKVSNAGDTTGSYKAWGFVSYAPSNLTTVEYLNNNNSDFNAIYPEQESSGQNDYFDGADLMLIVAHGSFGESGSSQLFDGSRGTEMSSPEYGGSIGDFNTEWYLTTACQSMGEEYIEMFLEDDEFRLYLNQAAVLSYRSAFENGIHGIGGFTGNSTWYPDSLHFSGNYEWLGRVFWNKIKNGKTIKNTWIETMELTDNGDHPLGIGEWNNFPAYIHPGPCNNDYVFDHFWGTGYTAPDPDVNYIKNQGICIHSGKALRTSILNTIKAPITKYPILKKKINTTYRTKLINKFGNLTLEDDRDVIKIVRKTKPQLKEITNQDIETRFDVESLKTKGINLVNEIKPSYLSIDKIEVLSESSQKFTYDAELEKEYIRELRLKFHLRSPSGSFSNINKITLGFNPDTEEVTTVISSVVDLEPDTLQISKADVDEYIAQDRNIHPDKSYKVVYRMDTDNTIKPILYRFDETTKKVEVVRDLSENLQ